jgi:hypothetical protein
MISDILLRDIFCDLSGEILDGIMRSKNCNGSAKEAAYSLLAEKIPSE